MRTILFVITFLAGPVIAAELTLTTPVAAGSGCQAAETSADLADGTILFQAPEIELSGEGKRILRKNCGVSLSLKSATPVQIAPKSVEYDVSANIPKTTDAVLEARMHYRGEEGSVSSEKKIDGEVKNSKVSLSMAEKWSPCGHEVGLTINTSLRAKAAGQKSGSVSAKAKPTQLSFETRSCEK